MGVGQDRQEREWGYKLKIIVDIVGHNILNRIGGESTLFFWGCEVRRGGSGCELRGASYEVWVADSV